MNKSTEDKSNAVDMVYPINIQKIVMLFIVKVDHSAK